MRRRTAVLAAALLASVLASGQGADGLDDLRRSFLDPPPDSRIMMRWWWFGPAVTKPELERELRAMKAGGIGGVEVQPVYPVALDDAAAGIRTTPYLSDEFIDALRFAADTARALGLRVDLTVGSGWPYGGPQVGIDRAAGRLRVERGAMAPAVGAGERLLATFDIDGSRDRQFFISSRTGMMVKRPAVGAEGFVVDHYDRNAIDDYLRQVGDRLLQAFGANPPYAVFCDSLEVYESDWTTDFLEQFKTRRGYDLTPHLPALVADSPQTAALRHDWGQTLTELLNERFVAPVQEWAHQHHTRLRLQGYGTPPATLSTNAHADLPEGEGAQWRTLSATRWASSASHVFDRPVTSSETWTWLHSPVFRATPLDMKAEADLHFLQGINQLIGHGWPYSPESVEYPGWRFYAAAVFSDKNPWWIVMPDVTRYLQRVSHLLRQGTPVTDVALYLPIHDAWARFTPGHVNLIETLRERLGPAIVGAVLDAGFAFDVVDDEALKTIDAARYRVVIVPGVERMPEATLQALERIAERGGAVIATRRLPQLAPGFAATDDDHARVRASAARLFDGPGPRGRIVRDERDLGAALAQVLPPDVALAPSTPDIGFIHRRTDAADVYFVANTGNVPRKVDATFRVTGKGAESWDPIRGSVSEVASRPGDRGTIVTLDLEPYGSRVLVFSHAIRPPAPVKAGAPLRANADTPLDISGGWSVSFGANGTPTVLDRLQSWTDDERTRYYSGTATYSRDVTVPSAFLAGTRRVRIDFGEGQPIPPQRLRSGMQAWLDAPVREAAVVSVNGREAGSAWCPPYSVDVTALLKAGINQVRIVVANLAVNHMAGHALPSYRLLNLRYGVRFEPQDMDKVQPVSAGLLGPIRLIAGEGR